MYMYVTGVVTFRNKKPLVERDYAIFDIKPVDAGEPIVPVNCQRTK